MQLVTQLVAGQGAAPPDTFWKAATVVVMALSGIAGIWVTVRSNFPKRKIQYEVSRIPLLSRPDRREVLEIRANGKPLKDPQLLEITLQNKSRRDIPKEATDNDYSLIFWFTARTVELIDEEIRTPGSPMPYADIGPDCLYLGAGAIGRHVRATYVVLVDGKSRCTPDNRIVHCTIEPGITPDIRARLNWRNWAYIPAVLAIGTLAGVGFSQVMGWALDFINS